MLKSRGSRLALAAVVIAAISSCSSNSSNPTPSTTASTAATSTGSARPTLTASKLQPPPQDNQYTQEGGRQKVVFDPCTWIPDDAVAKLGYDPSTRRRLSDFVAEYTFLTCQFSNADTALNLNSGNISLEEDKQRYAGKTQDVTINGRDAVIVHKTSADDCVLDMRTKAGYFEVLLIVNTPGQLKGIKPCDHIVEVATALEPYIGKDN
ncbi:DUF3558 domain-containing protein [Nocardia transvalensis]|uniref:DUF3558 domain-containing protein n=1 Tax=Nocardia transvalensis TaxID=37333 RepID=UPI0018933027|nr:DUF3558 domain-containing protein [Nocardia transvalensis]MBF6330538.1 DUF3558 domain-containing protein [Nocardia transvalensis]